MSSRTWDTAVGIRCCYQCPSQLASESSFFALFLGMGQARLCERCSNYICKPHPIFHMSLLAIKLHRSFPYHPFLLNCVCLSPALKILAANSQIQVLFGSGINCSGAQGREERRLKVLWRLMASNSLVFKVLALPAVSRREVLQPRLEAGRSSDCAGRWPRVCCRRCWLCLSHPCVCSWGSSSHSSVCLTGACKAGLNPGLPKTVWTPPCQQIYFPFCSCAC